MVIHTVWVQREQAYPGQYLPELIAAIDSNGHDANPKYIQDELAQQRELPEIVSAEHIILNLQDLSWERVQELLSNTLVAAHSSAAFGLVEGRED